MKLKSLVQETNWKQKLTPEQYHLLREKGTELPFTGKLLHILNALNFRTYCLVHLYIQKQE